ncbi:hypothetical protein GSC38_004809, partial [Salmonella enterica]|nr:hypothetical protein [Salmonella enterica]
MKKNIVIFSRDWTRLEAIKQLCYCKHDENKRKNRLRIDGVSSSTLLFDENLKADILILDIPPRKSIGLMHKIRKIHRNVFILFIQDSFYFSDYVVCLYFGWSGMKECSERIDITSGLNLITYISSNEYMQVYACPRVIDKEEKEEDTICNIRSFLYDRLSWIVDSKTQRHIIIESA